MSLQCLASHDTTVFLIETSSTMCSACSRAQDKQPACMHPSASVGVNVSSNGGDEADHADSMVVQ